MGSTLSAWCLRGSEEEVEKLVGHICVRGAPLFAGYEQPDRSLSTKDFSEGWFDTVSTAQASRRSFNSRPSLNGKRAKRQSES